MANKSELALRLLQKLGVVGSGQTAKADDQSLAEEKIGAVHAVLMRRRLVRWTLADVPEDAAEGYALMASPMAGPEFGAQVDPGSYMAGMRLVAAAAALAPSDDPVAAEYF